MEGVCPDLTCDIPDPATPGWTLKKDFNGCLRWFAPAGPYACGTPPVPPIEAGPPCAPLSVASYVPAPMTPPNTPAAACTAQDIGDFYDACIGSDITSGACATYQAAHAACASCLVSAGGPVVVGGGHTKVNIAGCVALVQGDSSATSCAQKVSDELGCEALACDAVCPVSADGGTLAYEQCLQQIAATDCRSYLDAECGAVDAGITACMSPTTKPEIVTLASMFCGGL